MNRKISAVKRGDWSRTDLRRRQDWRALTRNNKSKGAGAEAGRVFTTSDIRRGYNFIVMQGNVGERSAFRVEPAAAFVSLEKCLRRQQILRR